MNCPSIIGYNFTNTFYSPDLTQMTELSTHLQIKARQFRPKTEKNPANFGRHYEDFATKIIGSSSNSEVYHPSFMTNFKVLSFFS